MKWLLTAIAVLLCWPAYASAKTTRTIEVECIQEADVKQALRDGKIARMGMGMNDNEELVILWGMQSGRFWLSWMTKDNDEACTLASGSLWLSDKPGAPL